MPLLLSKSLWLDEAWVATDVLRRSFDPASLRTVPVGFALLIAAVVHVAPVSQATLRLVPLAFGLGVLPLAYLLARRLYDARLEAHLVVLLLSTNLAFVTYCRTVKPYTADMFFAVLLFLLADRIAERSKASRWLWYGGALLSAPLLWFGVRHYSKSTRMTASHREEPDASC